jgi:hypothetical protein
MAFTVVHQGGMKEKEYQAYLRQVSRQLIARGVGLDNVPRVPEGGTDNRWLYVWADRQEAEAFAKELEQETRDPAWHVRPVNTPPSLGPLRPIEIEVSRQRDGLVFALNTFTWKALQIRFPGCCRRDSVFIGQEPPDDLLAAREELRDLARQVLLILTELSAEQLQAFGTFRVVDPVTGEEFVPPTPVA